MKKTVLFLAGLSSLFLFSTINVNASSKKMTPSVLKGTWVTKHFKQPLSTEYQRNILYFNKLKTKQDAVFYNKSNNVDIKMSKVGSDSSNNLSYTGKYPNYKLTTKSVHKDDSSNIYYKIKFLNNKTINVYWDYTVGGDHNSDRVGWSHLGKYYKESNSIVKNTQIKY
ncbi:hypothetical protein [Lactobacillus sp. Sy-1]|uniref:hypothetical protein n=1 Tax=Lactobacillus sp. Sy-1 TaxID=2109645 RepID=UPI001C5AD1F4|nr:hypothetical protein [Lactobacillus sp. Sy-1]MBW1606091.1 hypothetical protein [Lactobacillus sp. Sy-1]